MIKPHKGEKLGEERVHISLQPLGLTLSLREVRAGPEAGTEAEAIEGHCLLASSHDFLWPRGTAYSRLTLPTSVINQENAVQICLRSVTKAFFLNEVPSSQMTLACVDKTLPRMLTDVSKAVLSFCSLNTECYCFRQTA